MTPNSLKAHAPLVYGVVAAGFLGSLLGLALRRPGGPSALEALVLVTGGLMLLLLARLPLRHRKSLDEVSRDGSERLLQAQTAADLHLRAVESLAIAIDAKDQTTHGHVRRTQVYALELGKLLNVGADELEALRAGALLHDVGNLAVPEYILNKPGRLTAAEFEKMKVHTSVGGDIVNRVGFPYPVEDVVRFHHERWDGTGYPRGLKGESIPLVARIVSAVDFYDSMRCDRPYRVGRTREESLALLRRMAGKSFDPVVVEMFATHVDEFDALLSPEDLREQVQAGETPAALVASDATTGAAVSHDGADGFRSIARAQREVAALHELAQIIGTSLSLQDTAALVAARLRAIVPFDSCAIYILDERSGKAEPVYAVGEWAEFFGSRGISVGEGITGWVDRQRARDVQHASRA